MVIVTVDFYPTKEQKEHFLTAFNKLAEQSRKEDGCISYDIYSKGENSNEYFLFEKWESKAQLETHLRTEHFVEFMNVSKNWFENENKLASYEAAEIQLG